MVWTARRTRASSLHARFLAAAPVVPRLLQLVVQGIGAEQPPAQVSAAIALLDRGWGRPRQALEVGINRTSLDEMSDAELLSIVNGTDEQKPTSAN